MNKAGPPLERALQRSRAEIGATPSAQWRHFLVPAEHDRKIMRANTLRDARHTIDYFILPVKRLIPGVVPPTPPVRFALPFRRAEHRADPRRAR